MASAAAAALGAGGARGAAYAFYALFLCFVNVERRKPQYSGENHPENKIFHKDPLFLLGGSAAQSVFGVELIISSDAEKNDYSRDNDNGDKSAEKALGNRAGGYECAYLVNKKSYNIAGGKLQADAA